VNTLIYTLHNSIYIYRLIYSITVCLRYIVALLRNLLYTKSMHVQYEYIQ